MTVVDRTTPNQCEFDVRPRVSFEITHHGITDVRVVPGIKCREEAETVDFVHGFRCAQHPPRWDQAYAQYLHDNWGERSAGMYRRTMITLLQKSILSRYTSSIDEAA